MVYRAYRNRYRVCHASPVRNRDLLHPLHPHRIIDVPEFINVLRARGQRHFEDGAAQSSTCVMMNA